MKLSQILEVLVQNKTSGEVYDVSKLDTAKHTVYKSNKNTDSNNQSTTKEPEEGPTKDNYRQYTMISPNGSGVFGTMHHQGNEWDPATKEFIDTTVLPNIFATADRAIKHGKKVVWFGEGGMDNFYDEANDAYRDNEQGYIASQINRRYGNQVEINEWDDEDTNLLDSESPIYDELARKTGMNKVELLASTFAFEAGQGSFEDITTELDNWFNPKDKALVLAFYAKQGIDDPTNREQLYDAAFPEDKGLKQGQIGKFQKTFNKLRQENLKRKIAQTEKDGGIALASPGASHAFQMKQEQDSKTIVDF